MTDADAVLPDDVALCHELIRRQAAALEQAERRVEQLERVLERLPRLASNRRHELLPDIRRERHLGLRHGVPSYRPHALMP